MISQLWSYRTKLLRYAGVSGVSLVVTQAMLYLGKGVLGWPGVVANVVAVCVAAAPAYLLNRAWVWGRRGSHSWRAEVVPFWSYNLLGLVFSTLLVAGADGVWGSTWSVMAANLIAFGVLWLGKFLFLEKVLFAPGRQSVGDLG